MGISAQMINQRTTGYLCDPVCHYVILRAWPNIYACSYGFA